MTNKEFFIHLWQKEQPITVRALRALPEGDVLNYCYQPKLDFRSLSCCAEQGGKFSK